MAESLLSQNAVQVLVEKIYVKDLSLENPGSPQTFKLTEPQAAKIVRRITGRVRLYARVFELVPAKK